MRWFAKTNRLISGTYKTQETKEKQGFPISRPAAETPQNTPKAPVAVVITTADTRSIPSLPASTPIVL